MNVTAQCVNPTSIGQRHRLKAQLKESSGEGFHRVELNFINLRTMKIQVNAHPLSNALKICTVACFTGRLTTPAIIFAFVANIPKFMEVEVVVVPETERQNRTEVINVKVFLHKFIA